MNTIHYMLKAVTGVLAGLIVFMHPAAAQDTAANRQGAGKASLENKLNKKKFVFVAQSISPLRGGMRQLTSYYDVKISGDTLASNLPYFGRAYSAPINPSDGGLSFTSVSFDYMVKTRKKGGWEIAVKTKDLSDNQSLSFTILDNKSVSLQVTGNNRDPVSFSGYLK